MSGGFVSDLGVVWAQLLGKKHNILSTIEWLGFRAHLQHPHILEKKWKYIYIYIHIYIYENHYGQCFPLVSNIFSLVQHRISRDRIEVFATCSCRRRWFCWSTTAPLCFAFGRKTLPDGVHVQDVVPQHAHWGACWGFLQCFWKGNDTLVRWKQNSLRILRLADYLAHWKGREVNTQVFPAVSRVMGYLEIIHYLWGMCRTW